MSQEEVTRNFRRNFIAGSMDFGLFLAGMSFSSSVTILPAFLTHFTSSNVLIGLISSVTFVGWMIPQILVANYTERLSSKKRFVLILGLGERVTWLVLAGAALLFAESPTLMLSCFFLLLGASAMCGGVGSLAWLDMLAKVIPGSWRGRFFGFSRFAGTGLGGIGALVSGYLIDRYDHPDGFAMCFFLTFAIMSVSWFSFSFIKEPTYPRAREKIPFREYFSGLSTILGKDRNFSRFLLASIFLGFSGMARSFYTVHAATSLNLTGSEIGIFTALFLASQTLTNLIWGYVGDKKGYRMVIIVSIIFNISAAMMAAFSASIYHFYLVFVAAGVTLSGSMISGMNIILEFSSPERRPTYMGLANFLRAPSILIAPILGGMFADIYSYSEVYVLTVAFSAIGLVLLLRVKDPRIDRSA